MEERKLKFVREVLAFLIAASVVACPFIRSMGECMASDAAIATCMMVVAVIVEIAAFVSLSRFRTYPQAVRLVVNLPILALRVGSLWPPGIHTTAFSTPLRI